MSRIDLDEYRVTREAKRSARVHRRMERRAVKQWMRDQRRSKDMRWGFTPQERKQIACFWTWPFGHVYAKTPAKSIKICMVCAKKIEKGNWGAGY